MIISSDSILLIVDVQLNTINSENAKIITDEIHRISSYKWNKIYAVKWFSNKNSTFHLTRGTLLSEKEAGETDIRIEKKLSLPTFSKQAPSLFANEKLTYILEKEKINGKNILIVGFDYDDCVLSSVLDGHSRNLRIYAIDELCGNAERQGKVNKDLIPCARLLLSSSGCLISLKDIKMINVENNRVITIN